MVNINSEVIVERIQKDGVNTIIIAAVIAILSWIFNMYHKSANKYRDQKDQQFREARATFESALKQINKDDTDFNEFYDLLKYTKTTDEYPVSSSHSFNRYIHLGIKKPYTYCFRKKCDYYS